MVLLSLEHTVLTAAKGPDHGFLLRGLLEELTEALAVPGNAFTGFAERKSVPVDLLGLLALQVDNALFTASAVHRAHVLLSKHRVLLFHAAGLHLSEHIVKSFQLQG